MTASYVAWSRWMAAYVLRVARRRLGWYVIAALSLLPCSGALLAFGTLLDRQLAQLERELSQPSAVVADSRASYWQDIDKGLSEFYALLPPAASVPEAISSLMALGKAEGVALQSGEYQANSEPVGNYLRYGMTFPISGDAADIQSFVLRALSENRTLSLESMTFKRQRVDSGRVESRLRMALLTGLEEGNVQGVVRENVR